MRRLLLLPLPVLLVALVVAPTASGAIVVQQGIAGVSLGDRESKIRARLGDPARVRRGRTEIGPYRVFVYRGGLRITFFAGDRVTNVSTKGTAQRTVNGVGVGTTEQALRANVRGERCETVSGFRICSIGRFLPGRRVTTFRIAGGKVRQVDIGFVID